MHDPQIWEHLPSFRFKSSIKTWLVRIVVNEVKQQFRKKQVPTVPLEQASEVENDSNEVETTLIHDEERQQLKQAFEKLPPEQRESLVLRYYSELTVPEIAAVMGEREGTIKSRLSRAIKRLGDIFRDDKTWEGGR